ncbi:MAG: hypothetical protein A2Z21_07925 [Candidatus Fraserbacteria bacterium RBG_16_55_9]|uniref:Uncharacterized protein n=1 Tax=Fraserbacteria sp. (strain RBG_16_55_9) TaxID=1817864 RepID=A0A1F5UQC1_FRAXR|nr:MAG: hypothetical protein A2Z21_07925 [Candidatus Fraserbacteria bacterium RBG_16_55_9]
MQILRRWRTYPWLLRLLWLALIALPLGVAALFTGVEISSQPAFCGTCHFMKPYYESWETSTHREVACVECHIPPGIAAEFRKKYEALSMVVSYFTGTYGTNPWAEVPDESCLRPGCHEQRLLVGRELVGNVLFDHRPHLTELRREKKLRCTSCHSQIVQGQHIAVTESTCFLCHFKEAQLNEGTAQCTLCHETPETMITTSGLSFDHADVKRFGMDCLLCHANTVSGTGEVPSGRCLTCHNEPARLARLGETEFLHRVHVTEHKVECTSCHVEIQHQIPQALEAVSTQCETCHFGGGHSPQRDIYVGLGGEGVDPQPAAMYLAGVSCESCHVVSKEGRKIASEVSCMSCHGAQFLKIYQNWQQVLSTRLKVVQSLSQKVQALIPPSELIRRAEENIAFVEKAHGVHNPGYASALLKRAHEDLQRALGEAGMEVNLEPPWPQAPYPTQCTACHLDAETIAKEINSWTFRHEAHVVRRGLQCTICHTEVRYQESQHGAPLNRCTDCHPARAHLEGARPQDCLQCHPANFPTSSQKVRFSHELHVNFGFNCTQCHTNVDTMDHLDYINYVTTAPLLKHELCGICHQKEVPPEGAANFAGCMKCHITF